MKKVFEGIKLGGQYLLQMFCTIIVGCGIWTMLVLFWQKGLRGIGFMIMNYLSGALLSLDGNNIVGGILGRTIILLVLNTCLTSLFMHKGSLKKRLAFAKADFKKGFKNVNEYLKTFLLFKTKQADVFFSALFGVGMSIVVNAFISGNGEFINTFSCLALFILLVKQIGTKSGFFVALVNLGARKLGYKNICGDAASAFLFGATTGCLFIPVFAMFSMTHVAYFVGAGLGVIGIVGLLFAKKKSKAVTAMLLLLTFMVPVTPVCAEEQENLTEQQLVVELKQGTVDSELYGEPVYATLSDVVVNGEARAEELIEIKRGDKFSFKITTNDITFLSLGFSVNCEKCGIGSLHWQEIPMENNKFITYFIELENYKAEFYFELELGTNIFGDVSGNIQSMYALTNEIDGYFEACLFCDTDYEEKYVGPHVMQRERYGIAEITLSDLQIMEGAWNFENESLVGSYSPAVELLAVLDTGEQVKFPWPELILALPDDNFRQLMSGTMKEVEMQPEEPEVTEKPETAEETKAPKEPEVLKESEETEEPEINLGIFVASVISSAVGVGIVAGVGPSVTSALEGKLGINKKKGELCVNGNVDIPTVHYEQVEEVVIPVNIVGGEEEQWLIAALAITPDSGKLVKATAIPTSKSSAEIRLKLKHEPKKSVTSFVEVTALAFGVRGERYFHETMVEVNIETEKKD